jgi:hypothetical protein
MVMDPSLIPQRVNVVIGEGLYELTFRVEGAPSESSAQLMDIDAFHGEGGSGPKDAGNSRPVNPPPSQVGNKEGASKGLSGGLGGKGSGQDAGHKAAMFLLNVHTSVPGEVSVTAPPTEVTKAAKETGVVDESSGVFVAGSDDVHNQAEADFREEDGQSQEGSMSIEDLEKALQDFSQGESMSLRELKRALEELGEDEEVSKEEEPVPDVKKLAAIPEVSLEQSSVRRSKRRARVVDEVVATLVKCRKELRNEGTSTEPVHLPLVDDAVAISNLDNIGISLGLDASSSLASWSSIKNSALGVTQEGVSVDLKEKVIEK